MERGEWDHLVKSLDLTRLTQSVGLLWMLHFVRYDVCQWLVIDTRAILVRIAAASARGVGELYSLRHAFRLTKISTRTSVTLSDENISDVE